MVPSLRPTRRLKCPLHPGGHRCCVEQFHGLLSVRVQMLSTTVGGSALLHTCLSTRKPETMWRCRSWSTGRTLARPSSSPGERPANAPISPCQTTATHSLRHVFHKRGVWNGPICGTLPRCGSCSINVYSRHGLHFRLHPHQPPAPAESPRDVPAFRVPLREGVAG